MKNKLKNILNEFFISSNLIAININEVGSLKEPIQLVDYKIQSISPKTLRYGFDDKTKNLIIVYKINNIKNHFESPLDNRFLQLSEYKISNDKYIFLRFFRLFLHTIDNKIVYIDFIKRSKNYNSSPKYALKYNYRGILYYNNVEFGYNITKVDLI